MKIKFLSYIFLLILVPFNLSFAKPLPPGTGNATPANILFLVDKSQSMHASASGNIANKMRPPTDVSGRGDGNYFVSGVDESGISYWDADQNKLKSDNNVFKGTKSRAHGFKNRKLGSPIQIEYHATTKRLYVLADQRDMSHGNQCKITHNGVAYNGGFIIYMFDTTKGQGGKNQVPGPRGSWLSLHSNQISGDGKGGFRNNCNTTKDSIGMRPASMSGKTAMAVNGNKLYVINAEVPGGGNKGGMYVFDIKPGGNGFNSGKVKCRSDLGVYKYFNEAIDVVTEGTETVMYSKDTSNGSVQIRRSVLQGDGCLKNIVGRNPPVYPDDKCGEGRGSSIVVKDKKIYTSGYFSHSICKYDASSVGISSETASFVSKVGVSNQFTANTATNSQLYLYYPMGIDFGRGTADQIRCSLPTMED